MAEDVKLKIDIMMVMILVSKGHFQNQCSNVVASRDKEVNHATIDYDDKLVCCVENMVEDRIMDSRASFHATYCKEELKGSSYAPDVRYIPSLKRRLNSVRQLDEEGYHHQRLGDMSMIGMSMLASKGNVLDVRKVDIYFCKPSGLGKQKNLSFIMSSEDKETAEVRASSYRRVAYSRGEMMREGYKSHTLEAAQMKYDTTLKIRRVVRLSEAEISHLWNRFMEPENDSIVSEHELSSEITKSLSESSDTSEESKNSRSFEDNGRSDKEDSEDGAFSKEGGSETPQVRRSTRESRAPVRYSPSANYLLLTENGEPESYSEALSSKESVQWKKVINEEMVSLEKNHAYSLVRIYDIQCAGFDHDHYQEAACAHHEDHMMYDNVQLDHVVDSHADYTSDINIILYDQYVKDNEVPVVHSDVSTIPTDAFMMIYDDICEPYDQSVSYTSRNTAVQNSLTAELATYKEHVELVAIGYKNPLCLTRAKQVQLALYNGHEIIKDNHTPAIVHNSEDTLEIAEITRKKMNDKMNDPECVTRKVKIAPHDYSKENFLATFTPQKQLTPEKIF
nr:retrovirus-related Pol polyprotein from transposon TNT 1-94 [Tanacetum cinerariifolium]